MFERIGRVKLLADASQLGRIRLRKRGPLVRLDSNPALDEIVEFVESRVAVPHNSPYG